MGLWTNIVGFFSLNLHGVCIVRLNCSFVMENVKSNVGKEEKRNGINDQTYEKIQSFGLLVT